MQSVGIVLELEEKNAIVMRQDGHFTRIPRTSEMAVGMEVEWSFQASVSLPTSPTVGRIRRPRAWSGSRWGKAGTVGAAACLVVSAGVWFAVQALSPTNAQAFAFVSLDINPSITIQVDKNLKVMSATGTNSDGVTLMQHVNVVGKPLKSAVALVVDSALQNHMIPQNDTILISTAPGSSDANVDFMQQQVETTVKSTLAANPVAVGLHPNVHALGLSSTVWDAAKNAQLSPGKLAAYLMAAQEGVSVSDVNQLTGEKLEQVLSSADADKVSKILQVNNPKEVAQLIQSLQTSGLLTAVTDDNGQGSGLGNHPTSGSKGESSKPQTPAKQGGGKGNGHGVTVHLGGSTLTVPLGGAHPIIQSPVGNPHGQDGKEHGSGHGNAGTDAQHGDGNGDWSGSQDESDGNDNGDGDDHRSDQHKHDGQDGDPSRQNSDAILSDLNAVLQNLQ